MQLVRRSAIFLDTLTSHRAECNSSNVNYIITVRGLNSIPSTCHSNEDLSAFFTGCKCSWHKVTSNTRLSSRYVPIIYEEWP